MTPGMVPKKGDDESVFQFSEALSATCRISNVISTLEFIMRNLAVCYVYSNHLYLATISTRRAGKSSSSG